MKAIIDVAGSIPFGIEEPRETVHLKFDDTERMSRDSTSYIDAKCPHCDGPVVIEAYSHYPGGRRLGQETLYSLDEKECDCDWKRGDAKKSMEHTFERFTS